MIQLTLTLTMTTAQVVETSVTVNNNSPIQDYVHPDDQTQPTFILLLVFYYSTKITLGVLLPLLCKRPVSIDRRNFSSYYYKALRLRQLRVKLISRVVKESSDSLFPGERRLISLQYSEMLSISLRFHCLSPDMFCTAFSHAELPRNIHAAREVTLCRF